MAKKNDRRKSQKPQQSGEKRDKQSSGSQQGQNHGQKQTADEDRDNDSGGTPRDAKGRFVTSDE